MRIIKTLTLIASLLAPQAAITADLTFRLDGLVEYDSNVFRETSDGEQDVFFRFRPTVKIHEDRGEDLLYSLEYRVPFSFAVNNGNELDDVDQYVLGNLTYRANDRLQFFALNNFRYLRSALRNIGEGEVSTGEGTVLINQNRDRTTLNDAEIGATYRFTPRLSGSARAVNEYFDTDREDRSENWLVKGVLDLNYVATPQNTLGMGVQVIHQEFDGRTNIVGSVADSYNIFGQWTFRFDETLSVSLAAGPTILRTSQDDGATSAMPPTIPSIPISAGSSTAGSGLLDRFGAPAVDPLPADGIIISQLPGCTNITGTTTLVFAGDVCQINNSSPKTTAGIVLDPVNDPVQFAAATTPTTVSNPFAEGETNTTVNAFAEAVIAKYWTENMRTALRYSRTQGGASGLGGAVIRDAVNLSHTWDFAERWTVAFRGDWSLRKSIQDSNSQFFSAGDPGIAGFDPALSPAGAVGLVTVRGQSTDIDTMRYGVSGRLTRVLARNTSTWVQLTYNDQTSRSGTLGNTSDFDDVLAVIGIRHVFDPVKLW